MNFWKMILLASLLPCRLSANPIEADQFNTYSQNPNLIAGRLFTVKIIPAGREVDIIVAGTETKKIVFKELKLRASILSGEQAWFTPRRISEGRFRFQMPGPAGGKTPLGLRIKIKNEKESEDFKFELR